MTTNPILLELGIAQPDLAEPPVPDAVLDALGHLWLEAQGDAHDHLDTIIDYLDTPADDAARARAKNAAHRLAGTLGTFGFPTGSDIARHMERALRATPAEPTVETLQAQCRQLRAVISA